MTTAPNASRPLFSNDPEDPEGDDQPDVPLDEPKPVPIEDPPPDGPSEPPRPMVVAASGD